MVDLEAPQSSPEPPESFQKELERAPKRLQNHFWIENADFSEMFIFLVRKINICEGGRVSLGAQNRHEEAPRLGKQWLRRRERKQIRKRTINLARKGVQKEVLSMQGATESPQKHQKSPQEGPKSTQNEPKRAPKHHQEHL